MSKSVQFQPDLRCRFLFSLFFAATTLIAAFLSFVWFISPLGLGFADWPEDTTRRNLAAVAFGVSYFAGIPMLVIAQICSAILAKKGFYRKAVIVPMVSIGSFALFAGLFFTLMG